MKTDYSNQAILTIGGGERAAAADAIVQLFNDEAQRETFSVEVNLPGDADDAPPVAYACSIQLTDVQWAELKSLFKDAGVKVKCRVLDATDGGTVRETTSGAARGVARKIAVMEALGELGVKVRRRTLETMKES